MVTHTKSFRDKVDRKDGPCSLRPIGLPSQIVSDGVCLEVRYLVAQLPHIDTKRSLDIAKRFVRPKDVFAATLDDWLSIPGIGKVTAVDIMKFLHE
jgi:Helix-hairpin-helix motif